MKAWTLFSVPLRFRWWVVALLLLGLTWCNAADALAVGNSAAIAPTVSPVPVIATVPFTVPFTVPPTTPLGALDNPTAAACWPQQILQPLVLVLPLPGSRVGLGLLIVLVGAAVGGIGLWGWHNQRLAKQWQTIQAELQQANQQLEQQIRDRQQVEMALHQLNQELELRVVQRTIALQENEERMRLALSAVNMGLWEADLLTGLEQWSEQSERLFGFAPGSFDGKRETFLSRVHPDDLGIVEQVSQTALETGQLRDEYRIVLPDQSVRWIYCLGKVFYDDNGTPVRMIGVDLDISDRKQTETELRQQKEVLQTVFDHLPVMVGLYSATGEILLINRELERVVGWQRSEFQTIDVLRECYPDPVDYQQVRQHIIAADSTWKDFKTRVRDGRVLDTSWAQIRLSDGRSIGIGQDITQRKAIERTLQGLNEQLEERIAQRTADLQASEARFRSFFDFAPIGIAVADVQTYQFEAVNQAFCSLMGYSEAELLNLASCVTLSVPEDWETERPHATALFNGEVQAYQIEKRYIKKNGDRIIGHLTTTALRNPAGEITHLLGMVNDITERKQAEELLRKREAHLRMAQRIAKLGSWEFSPQTGKISWSDEVFRMYNRDPALGTPTYDELRQYISVEDWQAFEQVLATAIATQQPYDFEHRILRPDGTVVYVLARGEIIYAPNGEVVQIIGTALDITDRKLAEQKIQQTVAQLAATNHELESFSYSVSHDLRAPLRHIHGFANALRQELHSHKVVLAQSKVDHYLNVIETSSQKMAQLIDGLLTLSRVSRQAMVHQSVSVRTLVQEAIALLQGSGSLDPNHPVEFVIGDLPSLNGDPILLQQVITNLLSNAVKFSRNHPTPRIEVGSLPDGIIFIKDNGVGFKMDYANKLFGAFQRLHSQRDFEGTGIGLAIVQRIIHRHGGSIWANGSPNQGASFYFTFNPCPAMCLAAHQEELERAHRSD